MDRDIIEYALDHALGRRVEYAEVRGNSVNNEAIILRNGVLEAYLRSLDSDFNVRSARAARMFETETSGNAGLVVPEAWNSELDPGNQSSTPLTPGTLVSRITP